MNWSSIHSGYYTSSYFYLKKKTAERQKKKSNRHTEFIQELDSLAYWANTAFYQTGTQLCFLFTFSLLPPSSTPSCLPFLSAHFPLSALVQQSRKRTHLSVLIATGGVLCSGGGGTWLAWTHGFRLLPCCKVIVIKSRLTVVDSAFEVQMSLPSILKSPLQRLLAYEIIQKKKS